MERDAFDRIVDIRHMVDQVELYPASYQFVNIRLELNRLQKQVHELMKAARNQPEVEQETANEVCL